MANASSSGRVTDESVESFLAEDRRSPQHRALTSLLHDALTAYLAG